MFGLSEKDTFRTEASILHRIPQYVNEWNTLFFQKSGIKSIFDKACRFGEIIGIVWICRDIQKKLAPKAHPPIKRKRDSLFSGVAFALSFGFCSISITQVCQKKMKRG